MTVTEDVTYELNEKDDNLKEIFRLNEKNEILEASLASLKDQLEKDEFFLQKCT